MAPSRGRSVVVNFMFYFLKSGLVFRGDEVAQISVAKGVSLGAWWGLLVVVVG
jgi:hypothetical protein